MKEITFLIHCVAILILVKSHLAFFFHQLHHSIQVLNLRILQRHFVVMASLKEYCMLE